ncbi:MAG: DUF192 domain-containing protein [Proteobacteria bacterium]|jgi:uncharacterized membrane protein (UPF0127 family)|nr:DUF192 domain-containing protein [Alphaproteobacteria bacterium]NCC03804.1 DUF192 domain-containing protein [Pseudomonadota bacterium]
MSQGRLQGGSFLGGLGDLLAGGVSGWPLRKKVAWFILIAVFANFGYFAYSFYQDRWGGEEDTVKPRDMGYIAEAEAERKPQKLDVMVIEFVRADGQVVPYEVEVAKTDQEQEIGLMYRDYLEPSKGMLFVYDKPSYPKFWMKNTNFSLDILFIGSDGLITDIYENVQPNDLSSIGSKKPSIAVVEIAGGEAASRGFRVGDKFHSK